MHKNAPKCNKTQSKWCINKHGASKIIDTFETYQLRDSKKGKVREHDLEISRRTKWDEVGHQEINGMQMRPGGVVSLPDRATSTRLRLEPLMPSVFTWFSLYWPKTNYIKCPMGIPERRRRRNIKNTKKRLLPVARGRLEGEPLLESPPATSPPSPTHPPCSPPWGGGEGVVHPPGIWVCGGNFVQSLYVLSLLKSIWCALHNYGTIYVIPMVVIVLWDDICYASTVCWDFMVCHTWGLHVWYMQWIYLCIMPCLPCHEVLDTTNCR
jgi:hypothetical protein